MERVPKDGDGLFQEFGWVVKVEVCDGWRTIAIRARPTMATPTPAPPLVQTDPPRGLDR